MAEPRPCRSDPSGNRCRRGRDRRRLRRRLAQQRIRLRHHHLVHRLVDRAQRSCRRVPGGCTFWALGRHVSWSAGTRAMLTAPACPVILDIPVALLGRRTCAEPAFCDHVDPAWASLIVPTKCPHSARSGNGPCARLAFSPLNAMFEEHSSVLRRARRSLRRGEGDVSHAQINPPGSPRSAR